MSRVTKGRQVTSPRKKKKVYDSPIIDNVVDGDETAVRIMKRAIISLQHRCTLYTTT